MRLCVPDFFDKFHCIAERCTDTCCVGWEIDVDEYTQELYSKVQGVFGKKLADNICDDHFKLTQNERCPFLDNCNLCEIIRNLGEEYLCDICREHPRFVEYFGDYKEQGIGLCCEEAVRLLLSSSEPLEFKYSDCDDYPDELSEEETYAIDEILGHRHNIFTILTQREYPLEDRIQRMLAYAEAVDNARRNPFGAYEEDDEFYSEEMEGDLNNGDNATQRHSERSEESRDIEVANIFDINSPELLRRLLEFLEKSESYGKEWDKAFKKIAESDINSVIASKAKQSKTIAFTDEESERIICYMIFRYYAKSFFDGQGLIKAKFAIAFWILLKHFAVELAGNIPENANHEQLATAKINAIKLLSKQLEYSEGNMALFEIMFMKN